MLHNALYIILNSGVQAALGFAFSIITARFFDPAEVGRASTLVSATSLLSFLGLLGLNTTFIRYLQLASQRNRLITAGTTLVAVCGGLAAVIYLFLIPRLAPSVAFVTHKESMAIGFVLLTAATGVNVLTDAIFIAAGKSSYNVIVDGVVGGIFKIVLILMLAGGGAFSIFGASSVGYASAAVVSLLLMVRALRWRPNFRNFWQVLRPVLSFSGANYVANVLNLLPSLVVPLIVLNRTERHPRGLLLYSVPAGGDALYDYRRSRTGFSGRRREPWANGQRTSYAKLADPAGILYSIFSPDLVFIRPLRVARIWR